MKKEFKPLAMKCNKEQFEAIKPKLKGMQIGYISNFNEWNYLVNNEDGYPFVICNTGESGSKRYNREIHETWNEHIFLEACGIETEETFEITKETIIKYKMKDEFPEVFKKEEQNGWYKDKKYPLWLGFFENDCLLYGFNPGGNYFINKKPCLDTDKTNDLQATEQEVFEALKNEAVKIGFKEGVYITPMYSDGKDYFPDENIINKPLNFHLKGNTLEVDGGTDGYRIFVNGKWTKIIPTKTKEEAEKLLNCKIV